jgi:hypothetical protein
MCLASIKEIKMKWIKLTVLSAILPYLIWSLYGDFKKKQSDDLSPNLTKLKEFGEIYKKRVGKYAFRSCHYYRTYTLNRQMEGAGCVKSMTVNSITYDTPTSSPRVIYRGKSTDRKYMCEFDLWIISEGKEAGEVSCKMTRFNSSEAYKIPVGRAATYARKLKEAKE